MIGTLDRRINVEDTSMAIVRFDGGAMGSVVNSALCPRQESHLRLDFQKGTMELRRLYPQLTAEWRVTPLDTADAAAARDWQPPTPEATTTHGLQMAAMIDAWRRGVRPPVSGGDARRTMEFITCLYKSAVTGEPVRRGTVVAGDPFYEHVAGTLARDEAEGRVASRKEG